MPIEAAAALAQGVQILAPVLEPHGFIHTFTDSGAGSGGRFAVGRFERADQTIEFHFRFTLGLVTYRWGPTAVSHCDLLLGADVRGAYPGYGKQPLDGFRHLAEDLGGPAAPFVQGDRAWFDTAVTAAGRPVARRLP